jgi:hypothetical protein
MMIRTDSTEYKNTVVPNFLGIQDQKPYVGRHFWYSLLDTLLCIRFDS